MDIPSQACITSDNVSVAVDGILYLQVMDSKLSAYGIDEYRGCGKPACSNLTTFSDWQKLNLTEHLKNETT